MTPSPRECCECCRAADPSGVEGPGVDAGLRSAVPEYSLVCGSTPARVCVIEDVDGDSSRMRLCAECRERLADRAAIKRVTAVTTENDD